jgi:hypothetical protein
MINNLPTYISVVFGLTTLATLILFYNSYKNNYLSKSKIYIVFALVVWLSLQAFLTLNNFYTTDTRSFPPRFLLLILPPFITILILFATTKGRRFIDSLSLLRLTYLNTVRVPVELVLYWLFLNKAVPELMTFSGRNFDILAGITAPVIAYFGFNNQKPNRKLLLIWNILSLGLLINIVINAMLSAPSAIQKFAFDQPNIAVFNFPFSWLPGFIVPIVLLGHLASILQLLKLPAELPISK